MKTLYVFRKDDAEENIFLRKKCRDPLAKNMRMRLIETKQIDHAFSTIVGFLLILSDLVYAMVLTNAFVFAAD